MSIYKASKSPYRDVGAVSTGIASLDKLTGVSGIPYRKITEVSGPFSVGKSTLALSVVAEAQKNGVECLWVDTEYAFDEQYATLLGVNIDKLNLLQSKFAEDILDETEEWANSAQNALVVLDSIGGLLPRAEAEKDASGRVIGGQAKLIATFCRKVVPLLSINNIGLLVLNHEFTDLMSGKLMTSGGQKLGYHKSLWIRLKRAQKRIMSGDNQVGEIITAEIRKNKLAPTVKQECELSLLFGQGFSKEADLMQEALDKGVITKTGQFYYLNGEKVARGLNGLREAFKEPSFAAKIKELSTEIS